MKEIYKNIFTDDVILPNSPLKSLNLYIIKSDERLLVVDSGFDNVESEKFFFEILDKAGAKLGNVDMYLTHLHADHSGLAYKFQQKYKGKVYSSVCEADFINAMAENSYFGSHLFEPELLGLKNDGHFFDTHPARLYCSKGKIDFTFVKEGDKIKAGDYEFEVLSLPGHTPDLTALYEKNHALLFSSDHILDKITPNISFWGFEYGDILGVYLKNLDKIYDIDVDIVFSSHRSIVYNHRQRIDELKKHDNDRLNDILNILNDGNFQSVAQIASKMRWDFRAKDFEAFPPTQKWFAAGEAMSHLEHLRANNMVNAKMQGEINLFSKK